MATIRAFEVLAVELPFKKPFRHAAAVRTTSDSLLLQCTTDPGTVGYGECLPRDYVSGETRDGVFALTGSDDDSPGWHEAARLWYVGVSDGGGEKR